MALNRQAVVNRQTTINRQTDLDRRAVIQIQIDLLSYRYIQQ